MKTYRLYQIDAFTRERFQGNPAGVVPNADGLTTAQMQAVARELNNSETAFILEPDDATHDVRIRFFTPLMEVPTCGHATISAHYVRALEESLGTTVVRQKIGIGTLPVEVILEDGDYHVVMTQGEVEFGQILSTSERAEVLAALGLSDADLMVRGPVQWVSTGSSKIIVPVASRRTLHAVTPDLNALVDFNRRIPNRGIFVFTLDSDQAGILTHGRMFNPQIGINEDPVTGNGNGPLGAYLVQHRLLDGTDGSVHFTARQGEAMGRPGTVQVTVDCEAGMPTRVRVGGDAVVAFQTEISL